MIQRAQNSNAHQCIYAGIDWSKMKSKKKHNTSLPVVIRSRRAVQLNRHRVVLISAVVVISGILPHFKIIRALHNQAAKLHVQRITSCDFPLCFCCRPSGILYRSIWKHLRRFLHFSTLLQTLILSVSWLKNTYRLHFIYEWTKWLAIAIQSQSQSEYSRLQRWQQRRRRRRRQQLWL